MTLFVFSFCLLAERFLGSLDAYREFAWFTRFRKLVIARLRPNAAGRSRIAVIIVLGVPVLAIQLAYTWISSVLAIFGFLFACATLLYCFGPKGFYEETRAFCDALRTRQDDTARWYASTILGKSWSGPIR